MLPVYPVVIPLLAAALLGALSKCISQRVSQAVALASAAATLAACTLLMRASAVQPLVYWFGNFRPRQGIALGISFTIEPLGAGLAALTSLLTVAALVFSSQYFDTVGNHFHSLLLAFLAAMCGFCLTGDLFNMFVFFELMSAAGFALCGYKTDDPGSPAGRPEFRYCQHHRGLLRPHWYWPALCPHRRSQYGPDGSYSGQWAARFSGVRRLCLPRIRLSGKSRRRALPFLAGGRSRGRPHACLHSVLGRHGGDGSLCSGAALVGRFRHSSACPHACRRLSVRDRRRRYGRTWVRDVLATRTTSSGCSRFPPSAMSA